MEKLKRKVYEKELARLHAELVALQRWVVHEGLRACVVFEGRDGAGKGGILTDGPAPNGMIVARVPAGITIEAFRAFMRRSFDKIVA